MWNFNDDSIHEWSKLMGFNRRRILGFWKAGELFISLGADAFDACLCAGLVPSDALILDSQISLAYTLYFKQ